MESIIVAIITSGLGLIGIIYSNSQSNKKIENQFETQVAVIKTEIKELTRS